MSHLLDVNILLAAIWRNHPHHGRVDGWLKRRGVATCALTELGFVRISSDPSAPFKVRPADARELLQEFVEQTRRQFISCDLPVLDGTLSATSAKVTDLYLADLAARHGLKLATLDQRITHPAIELLPTIPDA